MLSKVLPFRCRALNQNPSSAWSNISMSNRLSLPSASNKYALKILPAFSLARSYFWARHPPSFQFPLLLRQKTVCCFLYLLPLQNTAASLNYNYRSNATPDQNNGLLHISKPSLYIHQHWNLQEDVTFALYMSCMTQNFVSYSWKLVSHQIFLFSEWYGISFLAVNQWKSLHSCLLNDKGQYCWSSLHQSKWYDLFYIRSTLNDRDAHFQVFAWFQAFLSRFCLYKSSIWNLEVVMFLFLVIFSGSLLIFYTLSVLFMVMI